MGTAVMTTNRRRAAWALVMAGVIGCARGGNEPVFGTAFDPSAASPSSDGTSETVDGPATEATGNGSADSTGQLPDASCCDVSPTPGCGNPATEICVCGLDANCCAQVWTEACVALASDPCADPACPPAATTTGTTEGSTGDAPPTQTCAQLADAQGWALFRCEQGDTQCNGVGTPTTDCEHCCEYCGDPGAVSCGDFAISQGWAAANCEWNGNGACGGAGSTATCDCDFCCEVGG